MAQSAMKGVAFQEAAIYKTQLGYFLDCKELFSKLLDFWLNFQNAKSETLWILYPSEIDILAD